MGFWNALGTGLADLVTFGGYSKEREREKQEELNKLQIQRENTTYQRTVEDMKKAGLNPLSMSGTNTAQPLTNPIKSENNTFDKAMQLGTTISSVATGLAQAKNLNASTVGMGIANAMTQKDLDYLNTIKLSPLQKTHQNQKELANISKGFLGRLGNDIYDNVGEKIDDALEKGASILGAGIDSLAKGEFGEAVKEIQEESKNNYEKIKDESADKSFLNAKEKEWKQNKKEKKLNKAREEMDKIQEEINKYSSSTSTESIKKVNELRKKYEEKKQKYEEIKETHWSHF